MLVYLSWRFNSFEKTEVDDHPGEKERAKQRPSHLTHVANGICHLQDVISVGFIEIKLWLLSHQNASHLVMSHFKTH